MTPDWNRWLRAWTARGARRARGILTPLPPRTHLRPEPLEDRLAPAFLGGVSVAAGDLDGDGYVDIVTGPGPGGGPHVQIFSGRTGEVAAAFMAYDPSVRTGVYVAVGDVTGDGRPDIVTAPAGLNGPHVKVFDGGTLAEVRSFYAFDASDRGGVTVATGDVDGDGFADVVAGRATGGSDVRVFSGRSGETLRTLSAYPGFTGGVWVATADVNRDGLADIVTGAGNGGSSHVRVFDAVGGTELLSFIAYESSFRGGVPVAGGDADGDGYDDVITGTGVGGGPRARVFSGRTGVELPVQIGNYFAYDPALRGGMYVATADVNADGLADVITGIGPGGFAVVKMFQATDATLLGQFTAYDPAQAGGPFAAPDANTPPTISAISSISLAPGVSGTVSFTVGDAETPPDQLVVRATSDTPDVVPNDPAHLQLGGVGTNRTLLVVPTSQAGDATITVAVRDARARTATASFRVTVGAPTDAFTASLLRWNDTLLASLKADGSAPPVATRAMAILNTAAYDVQNAFAGRPGYFATFAPATGADLPAALATAAHAALSFALPSQAAAFDAELAAQLGPIPNGAGKDAGAAFGRTVAAAIVDLRRNDGSLRSLDFPAGAAPGEWRPTPPAYAEEQLPQWATVTPFVLDRPDQFRPDAPPAVGSPEWLADLDEVRRLGRDTSPDRTADQSATARLWADGAGTVTPPGHWLRIALDAARATNADAATTGRMLAALSLALADTSIAAWDAKFTYATWRPVTAIREGGDPSIQTDPTWTPLLVTPNHPEYVSGHSTYSRAAATVLEQFFPGRGFTTSGTALGQTVTRSYASFDAAANDAGRSRVYGGIHFEFSNQAGQALGRAVAEYVLGTFAGGPDTTGPAVTFSTPNGQPRNVNITIAGRVNDRGGSVASLVVRVDGGAPAAVPVDPATGGFSLATALATDGSADGDHSYVFTAIDAAGNTTAATFTFRLDTRGPDLAVTSPAGGDAAAGGLTLTGTLEAGATSLTYSLDEPAGPKNVPVPYAPAGGAFSAAVDLRFATPGTRTLTVTATDAAGNSTTVARTFDLTARPALTVTRTLPADGAADVGVTYRPRVFFSRPVAAATGAAIFAVGPGGETYTPTVVLADDKASAWVFFGADLPGGAALRLVVDGSQILGAADGVALDAAGSGTPGSRREVAFTTVSRTAAAGVSVQQVTGGVFQPAVATETTITGVVADPGPDLKPGTADDVAAGGDGLLMTKDDVYKLPLAGVTVYALGREDVRVPTDANGRFTLTVPSGTVKLAIDGRTATNAPAGAFFPEMVMDLVVEPGGLLVRGSDLVRLENTVMGSMGTAEQRAANEEVQGVYLPRVAGSILRAVTGGGTTITADAAAAPTLTPEQRAGFRLGVPAGTTVLGASGATMASAQVGVSAVPVELVREMLPQGVPAGAVDFAITIQAPGVTAFATPLQLTVPNTSGAAPGTKLQFFSFDHTTGRLEIEGTATVSADGKTVTTDPGQGITHPGWHGTLNPGVDASGLPAEIWTELSFLDRVERSIFDVRDFVKQLFSATNDLATLLLGDLDSRVGGLARLGSFLKVYEVVELVDNYKKVRNPALEDGERAEALLKIQLFFAKQGGLESEQTKALEMALAAKGLSELIPNINQLNQDLTDDLLGVPVCEPSEQQETDHIIEMELPEFADVLPPRIEKQSKGMQALADILAQLNDPLGKLDPSKIDSGLTPEESARVEALLDEYTRQGTALDSEPPFWLELSPLLDTYSRLTAAYSRSLPSEGRNTAASRTNPPSPVGRPLYWSVTSGSEVIRGRGTTTEAIKATLAPGLIPGLAIYDPLRKLYGFSTASAGAPGQAVAFGLAPLLSDTGTDADGDGLSDQAEAVIGTNPHKASTAGDGVSDGAKVAQGLDPLGGRLAATGVVSQLDFGGSATAVAVVPSTSNTAALTAFVAVNASARQRLAVVDVSDPVRPTLLTSLDLGAGSASRIAVDADLGVAAVAGTNGVQFIDIADPTRPTRVASVSRVATAVQFNDGVAYLAAGTSLVAVDPFSGEELVTAPTGMVTVNGMTRDGSFLFLSGVNGSQKLLKTIDLTDPTLIRGRTVPLTAGGGPVFVGDGTAYVVVKESGNGGPAVAYYTTVDVSDPMNPTGVVPSDFGTSVGAGNSAVAVAGGGLGLLTAGAGAEKVLDVFDLEEGSVRAAFRTRYNLTAVPRDVTAAAGLAFVATSDAGLTVVNYRSTDTAGQPPTVSLTLPGVVGNTAQEGAPVAVRVVASDDAQVRSVEVLVNGRVVRTDVSFPYSTAIDLPTLAANGSPTVTLTARATDTGGNVAVSAPVVVTLTPDTTPPTLVTDPPLGPVRGEEFGTVRLRFSEPIDPAALTAGAFALVAPGGATIVPRVVRQTPSGKDVILNYPTVTAGTYQFVIHSALVKDRVGLALGTADRTFPIRVVRAIASRFETGPEDWTLSNDAATPEYRPAGGNPGGHIFVQPVTGAATMYWTAPSKFLGDQSAAYGLTLSFDLWTDQTDGTPGADSGRWLQLRGTSGGQSVILFYQLQFPATETWTKYAIPLVAGPAWRIGPASRNVTEFDRPPAGTASPPTDAQFRDVLGTLTGLHIPGEYSTGQDSDGLDNVVLLVDRP
ncbi:MAG: FG-GAP-like repeat-containing protein [Gemmataceae bacterium]